MQTYQDKVNKLASLLKERKYIVVLTGAGISTESGLPDFRSSGGLWDGEKPEEISHWSAVGTEKFKKFFSQRIKETESHSPNIAHKILAAWQKEGKIKSIITQNIDGYHIKAGAYDVLEMHGHLRNLYCDECLTKYDNSFYTLLNDDYCERDCEGTVRPEVVLFGEQLPTHAWRDAQRHIKRADLVLVLGTSLEVFPFNSLVNEAYQEGMGAKIAIVTKGLTQFDYLAAVRIYDSIGKVLNDTKDALTNN